MESHNVEASRNSNEQATIVSLIEGSLEPLFVACSLQLLTDLSIPLKNSTPRVDGSWCRDSK